MAQTSVDEVFRDFNTPGNPGSGEYKPEKPRIRALLKQIMNQGGQAVTRNTYAALSGVTPPTENYMGVVLNDPDPTKNGFYARVSSAWVWQRGFPDTFAKVALSGTGTAQTGSVDTGVNPSDIEVFFAVVATPNTGAMTLSIGGEAARQVVNVAGNALSAGEWTGVVMFFLNGDGKYQLINDAGAAAAAAASASAAQAAQTAAEQALADFNEKYLGAFADDTAATAAAGGSPITGALYWDTTLGELKAWGGSAWEVSSAAIPDGAVTDAKLATTLKNKIMGVAADRTALAGMSGTDYATVSLIEAGRQGIFDSVTGDFSALVTADTEQGIYVAKTGDPTGASSAWVRRYNYRMNIQDFGGVGNSNASHNNGNDDTDAFKAMLAIAAVRGGGEIYLPGRPSGNYYRFTEQLEIEGKNIHISGDEIDSKIFSDHAFATLNFGTTFYASNCSIKGLFFTNLSTGGEFLKFTYGLVFGLIEDCSFKQNNINKVLWRGVLDGTLAQIVESTFQRCVLNSTASQIASLISLTSNVGSRVNMNVFHRLRLHSFNSTAANEAMILGANGSTGFQGNTITHITGEQNTGGLLLLQGCEGTLIDNVTVHDLQSPTPVVHRNMIQIADGSGGVPCRGTTIRNYQRTAGVLDTGRYDIFVNDTQQETTIINPVVRDDGGTMKIRLGTSDTTLIGVPSGATIQGGSNAIIPSVNSRGSWTPTLTGVDNVASSTAAVCYYSRQGDEVQCWGSLAVTPTAAAPTTIGISLPIASALASANDLSGVASGSVAGTNGLVEGDDTNDRAQLRFVAPGTSAYTIKFNFNYKLLS